MVSGGDWVPSCVLAWWKEVRVSWGPASGRVLLRSPPALAICYYLVV